MNFFFIFKLAAVLFFLVMFLRSPRPAWGIGLLAVSSAFLLDTFLGTFGPEEMRARLGFFFYLLSGAIFAGAALWLWALLREPAGGSGETAVAAFRPAAPGGAAPPRPVPALPDTISGYDVALLQEDIQERLGPGDLRDLIFDLEMAENEVLLAGRPFAESAGHLLERAAAEGKIAELALAVERVLTPIPAENLPRREKLSAGSPPTVLRHFLLAHYSLAELAALAERLEIDWEQLGNGDKREMVRGLLLYLERRGRMGELVPLLREPVSAGDGAS